MFRKFFDQMVFCLSVLSFFLFTSVTVWASSSIEIDDAIDDVRYGQINGIAIEPLFSPGDLSRVSQQAIRTVDNQILMNDYGLRVLDKIVPITIQHSSLLEERQIVNANGIHQSRFYTKNSNGKCSGGEWIEVLYKGAAMYHGSLVDIKVRAVCQNSSSIPNTPNSDINTSQFRVTNFNRTASFREGISYYSCACVHISYEFYYHGTTTYIPLNKCYFSFGSLNLNEGIRPTNYSSVDYFKQYGAYPNLCTVSSSDTFGDGNYWGNGTWLMNQASNNFTDTVGQPTFWKSVGSMDISVSNYKYQFDCYGPHFWFVPSVGSVGATAPLPVKYIKDESGDVTSVTGHSGDTIVFCISQSVEEYGYFGSGFLKYSNFSFSDILPSGVTYQSARILRNTTSGTTDVTGRGNLNYNNSTRNVSFSFSSSYLTSGMLYEGESYVFEITVKLDSTNVSRTLMNKASTIICNTPQNTNSVTIEQYCYPVSTKVRWRDVNGNWTSYEEADKQMVEFGDAYSYTWVRNALKSEPENVYYDGNPKTVGVSSVTESKDYYIDVERKKYTYTFEANPPAGYAVIGISNLQPNLENRWAETVSGNVTSPSLTGYTFVGWNTRSDGSGSWYVSESMLSNKTFYAIWRKNKYQIHYEPNGGSNPDHLEGEAVQNLVTGVMSNSEYEYDTKGSLRPNAFVRSGYEFIGWNTRADGTGAAYGSSPYDKDGKYYSDGYANVYNMTTADGAVLNLYAQWRKKLGSEVLTVVSEETGNPVANVKVKLYKKVNGSYVEVPGVGELTTNGNGQVSVSNLHWFDYEWRCTSVPKGYELLEPIDFGVRHDHLDWSHRAVLYLKHVNLILHARVSNIISGERAPSFLYQVSGTDAAGVHHDYVMEVAVDGSAKIGDSKAQGMYAGTYQVTQMAVSRYVPQNAENVLHSTVSGINGTANLLDYDRAEIRFPYVINQYEGFGSMNHRDNLFKTNVVEIRSARSFVTSLILQIEGIADKTLK